MKRRQSSILTAVLVDYDNIYLALRRKSDEAAKRFAKDSTLWLKEIESGKFAKEWIAEYEGGYKVFNALRKEGTNHQIEKVGAKLRSTMSWIKQTKMKKGASQASYVSSSK